MSDITELSRQPLPRRPLDYDEEPSSLGPLPLEHVTSPGGPRGRRRSSSSSERAFCQGSAESRPGADPERRAPPPPTMIFNERCAITRADLWMAVGASAALAVVVTELLHAAGLFVR